MPIGNKTMEERQRDTDEAWGKHEARLERWDRFVPLTGPDSPFVQDGAAPKVRAAAPIPRFLRLTSEQQLLEYQLDRITAALDLLEELVKEDGYAHTKLKAARLSVNHLRPQPLT